ncbi:MAG: peptidoglycan DD-metalloendopeptidase family protein [Epsilonproteobacteria bacterium]|nr:peptidoglycan DD-metalloendopeptidase family protein [Campylobacterota bacterium]
MNSTLDKIVKQIKQAEIYLHNINQQINTLNQKINTLKQSLQKNNSKLALLEKSQAELIKKKGLLEQQVIDFIANNYYIQTQNATSQEDMINQEILEAVTKQTAKKMDKITQIYSDINHKITQITQTIADIKNTKLILQKRIQELALLKHKQQQNLKALQAMKARYKNALEHIINSQNKLQSQLAKLNIIKSKELKRQRELANKELQANNIDKVKVKKYGNIYMATKTASYRGLKTIPPVKGVIIKKFGAYKDPIYKISLYNDSITIKTKPNSKVRAIFDGVVVYVGKTNDGAMIVIKHRNKLHSIYAKLSRLSPFIKKGYRVKKGEVIAKVNNELEFEITYKTLPINPLEVINFAR